MDWKNSSSVLFVLAFSLLFAGCPQEVVCATNNDCSPGTFCVNERCSTLLCSQEGRGCRADQDCCGSLSCVNEVCERIPELEKSARIIVGENSQANVYGVLLKTGKISPAFGKNCELLGGSAEIELNYAENSSNEALTVNNTIVAGKAFAKFEAITGNVTASGACEIESKRALIHITGEVLFEDQVAIGSSAELGVGTTAKLLKVSPSSSANLGWQEFSLSEGQKIPGESITVFLLSGVLDNPRCKARGAVAVFLGPGGNKIAIPEGETSYIEGNPISVDSISFFDSNCESLAGGPIAKIRFGQSPPCRYARTAVIELLGNEQTIVQVSNEKLASTGSVQITLDPVDKSETCISTDPVIRINFTHTDSIRLAEGTSAVALEDVSVRLDRLDIEALGNPCAVTAAEGKLSVKQAGNAEFGSVLVSNKEMTQFSGMSFGIKEVSGEFVPSKEKCALQGPKLMLSVFSPDGSGGVFSSTVPADSVLFIESETNRDETDSKYPCIEQFSYSEGYSFNKAKRELGSFGQKPTGPWNVAFGKIKRTTGDSRTFLSTLSVGQIPFENSGLEVLGVNKAGDASLIYYGMPLVLAFGEEKSFESNSEETFSNCTLKASTIETIRNYGFVKSPG
ncbi:MAG: dickkopf-related protein [Candidatus Micrarchaeota archaeon]